LNALRVHERIHGLYAVTPDTPDTQRLVELTRAALAGGARVVQYRNKVGPRALLLEQARSLKELCAAHGATFIVNDYVDIALELDADGIHIGKDDPMYADARKAVGPDKIIGVSCYRSLDNAHAAQASGVDYVAFGSFFASRVKPGAVRAPLDLLTQAKAQLSVPVVAIGGITPENAPQLGRAGADAIAVISALFDVPDVTSAARKLVASFETRHE
jgi:thiamine-phosphate pyrophosphorylase